MQIVVTCQEHCVLFTILTTYYFICMLVLKLLILLVLDSRQKQRVEDIGANEYLQIILL